MPWHGSAASSTTAEHAGLIADPGDDYLVALTRAANVDALVSGDRHLLEPTDHPPAPVQRPRDFLDRLNDAASGPSRD